MKRLRMWLRELSLSQQLILIIFSFLIVLAVFIFVFLSPMIDSFAETEMYRSLHNSQDGIIKYIERNEDDIQYYNFSSDSSISNAVYNKKSDELVLLSGSDIPDQVKEDIRTKSDSNIIGTQDYEVSYIVDIDNNISNSYLYSITNLQDDRYAISAMADANLIRFRQSLMSGVVVTNIMFFSILFGDFIFILIEICRLCY